MKKHKTQIRRQHSSACLIAAGSLMTCTAAFGQTHWSDWADVAKTGDAVPLMSTYLFSTGFGFPIIAQNGDVMFSEQAPSTLVNQAAICASDAASSHALSLVAQNNTSSIAGTYYYTGLNMSYFAFSSPSSTTASNMAVFSGTKPGSPALIGLHQSASGMGSRSNSVAILKNDATPGDPTKFFYSFERWTVSTAGTIVTPAYIDFSIGNLPGLYQVGSPHVTIVPGYDNVWLGAYTSSSNNKFAYTGINSNDEIAWQQFSDEFATDDCTRDYSVHVDAYDLTESDSLPWSGGTAPYGSYADPIAIDVNDQGDFVFAAKVHASTSPSPCYEDTIGIWYAERTGSSPSTYTYTKIVQEGDTFSDSCCLTFGQLLQPVPLLLISGRGGPDQESDPEVCVVFYAKVPGSTGFVDSLWSWTPSNQLVMIAKDVPAGSGLPGGGRLELGTSNSSEPGTVAVNARHDVVFFARVEEYDDCVTFDQWHPAIFAWEPPNAANPGVRLITKVGLPDDTDRVITQLQFVGGSGTQDGRPTGLNDNGQIVAAIQSVEECGSNPSERVVWSNLDDNTDTGVLFETCWCDSIDFNNDFLFPDTADIDDFLVVFAGGPCPTADCNDIDFNNDCLFPDTLDIDALLSVFAGGPCLR